MERDGIDFLCIAPHKGLYAPMGVGILIARKPIPYTLIEGGTGTNSESPMQPDFLPERLESGTVNVPGILGAAAGIDFVKKIGQKNIHRREMNLTRRAYRALEKIPRVILYTPMPDIQGWTPVLSFNIDGLPSFETAAQLGRQGIAVRAGLHCAPGAHRKLGTLETGTVRICPSVFTKENEIDYFINCVKKIAK